MSYPQNQKAGLLPRWRFGPSRRLGMIENQKALTFHPLSPTLQCLATKTFEERKDSANSGTMTLKEAGLLALHMLEQRRSKGNWHCCHLN